MDQHMEVPPVDHAPSVRLISAILAHADRSAAAVAAYLRAAVPPENVEPDGKIRISKDFALELAAILQIGAWEESGLTGLVSADLPSADNALIELLNGSRSHSTEAGERARASLMRDVLMTWLKHFAWQGPALLGVDVVVDGSPDNLDLEEFVEFLWANRRLAE